MKLPWLIVALSASLSSCVLYYPTGEMEARTAIDNIATVPSCASQSECAVKWAAARQWIAEYAAGNANYKAMKQADLDHPIEAIGKKLRANMKWLASSNPAPSKPATDAAQPQSEAA